jgi:hypothetical protein
MATIATGGHSSSAGTGSPTSLVRQLCHLTRAVLTVLLATSQPMWAAVRDHFHVGVVCSLSAWPPACAVMSSCQHWMRSATNPNLIALHEGIWLPPSSREDSAILAAQGAQQSPAARAAPGQAGTVAQRTPAGGLVGISGGGDGSFGTAAGRAGKGVPLNNRLQSVRSCAQPPVHCCGVRALPQLRRSRAWLTKVASPLVLPLQAPRRG